MYQALYRKWRPQTFDDVVGQEHITATLKRQVETERLSHAYLFIGTRGTGKTTCAKILARAVNCERPKNGNPCNECASCRGILDGSILDVVELDAASNNGVSDVRALQDEAIFSPASVKKRVYIIDEVHMLSTPAFNALLKILEEPPGHLMFILCTTELHKVLPTIISRCQRHSFKRIEPDAIAGRLSYVAQQEGMDLTPEAAALLARLADGGMRDAFSLLDQCSASEHIDVEAVHNAMGLAGSRRIQELLDAVIARSPEQALHRFDALWKDGKDPAGILEELGDLLRDVMLLQVAPRGGETLLSGLYDVDALRRFGAQMTGSDLMDAMDAIRAADLTGANPRRAAEICLVRLCAPETGDSVAALKSRISRLELALQNGASLPASVPAPAQEPTASPAKEAAASVPPQPVPDELPPWEEPPAHPIPVSEDDFPPYSDDDAPPEDPPSIPVPIEPEQAAPPPPAPAPAVSAASDTEIWTALVKRMNGKLDLGTYSMLSSPSQAEGTMLGETMHVFLATPIAKMMLDKPDLAASLQQELAALTGTAGVRVIFTDQPITASAPDLGKLDALRKFPNVKFE